MAEEAEGQDTVAEVVAAGADPAAMALALGGASREKADTFLEKQSALTDLQKHHLHEQFEHLRLTIWEKRLGVVLRIATTFIGIALACFITAVVWSAAQANGLIIDSFSVPQDLAQRGLTGDVVAGELLSRLSKLQTLTSSIRSPSSFTNNWGDDIKVEIPETGVSIGELNRFLRSWLGHETHFSGAVFHTAIGIAVSVHAGQQASLTTTGIDADLGQLLDKVAESIYQETQPYRYGILLVHNKRFEEANTLFRAMAANGSADEVVWALNGLSVTYRYEGDFKHGLEIARRVVSMRPNFVLGPFQIRMTEEELQHSEAALLALEKEAALNRDPETSEQGAEALHTWAMADLEGYRGNYKGQIELLKQTQHLPDFNGNKEIASLEMEFASAAMHDPAAPDEIYSQIDHSDNPNILPHRIFLESQRELALHHWSAIITSRAEREREIDKILVDPLPTKSRLLWPAVAMAMAQSGDIDGAHALIDKTSSDCHICLRTRGRIDALEKNWGGAAYWFGRAVNDAPSLPFAFVDWGQALLDQRQMDAAIAKFTVAYQKGPKFADPLEGWGEALMAKNQSHLALAKFKEAEKYAPNWGRLHLKWGEALMYTGKKEEARAQYQKASTLDLRPDEKAELARLGHG